LAATNSTDAFILGSNRQDLYIGQDSTGNNFNGGLDEVRIYDKVLTENEVEDLYQLSGNLSDLSEKLNKKVDSCLCSNDVLSNNSGIIASYYFENDYNLGASSSTAIDYSGKANDLTCLAGECAEFIWNEGKHNTGVYDLKSTDEFTSPNINNVRTISFWFRTKSTSDQNVLSYNNWDVQIQNGKLNVGALQGKQDIDTNIWYHVVIVEEGANDRLYINSKLEDQGAVINFAAAPLNIGRKSFIGYIDQVEVYNYVIRPSEIVKEYYSSKQRIVTDSFVCCAEGISSSGCERRDGFSGIVYDDELNPIENARVEVLGTKSKHVTYTDKDGYYYFTNIREKNIVDDFTFLGSITDDATIPLAGPSSIFAQGGFIFSVGTENALNIISTENPTSPTHISSLENGNDATLLNPTSVYVSGDYAYVASRASHSLSIIDISDKNDPKQVGVINDTGVGGKAHLNGSYELFISGNYAYVVSRGSDMLYNDSLSIIDISNPKKPIETGFIDNDVLGGELHNPTSVFVKDNYVFISSEGSDNLLIIDVSDRTNPKFVGNLSDSQAGVTLGNPTSVFIKSTFAYVTTNNALVIVNITDPTNPEQLSSLPGLANPEDVFVRGDHAYVVEGNNVALINVYDKPNLVTVRVLVVGVLIFPNT